MFALVRAFRANVIAARLPFRPRAINSYLKTHPISKLQLGAGHNLLGGWLNTDLYPRQSRILYLDVTKKFPFRDRSFDYVYSEHHIEQVSYPKGLFMLGECFRILKVGGTLRIATPSLETMLELYKPNKSEIQERYIRWITDSFLPELGVYKDIFVINNSFRNHGHLLLYDQRTLEEMLEQTGFVNVTRCAPGESGDESLRGIERHGVALRDIERSEAAIAAMISEEEMNRFETMVFEARRPEAAPVEGEFEVSDEVALETQA